MRASSSHCVTPNPVRDSLGLLVLIPGRPLCALPSTEDGEGTADERRQEKDRTSGQTLTPVQMLATTVKP